MIVATSPRVDVDVVVTLIATPFNHRFWADRAAAAKAAVPTITLGSAFAVTPVVPLLALIAAAMAIPLAAFVDETCVISEAVSDADKEASMAVPLMVKVPASKTPEALVTVAKSVATVRATDVTPDTLAV